MIDVIIGEKRREGRDIVVAERLREALREIAAGGEDGLRSDKAYGRGDHCR